MKLRPEGLSVSPTDLSYFLSCRHRTALELSVAHGVRKRPQWNDPLLEALFELGLQHERRYVERLRSTSQRLVDLGDEKDRDRALGATADAMRSGADVIVQAALADGSWYGRPDVLIKVDRPSPRLGRWSYEVADTKLARETRGGTIMQLGVYSELIHAAQELAPAHFHVVTPADPAPAGETHGQIVRTYRVDAYAAYFRLLKAAFEEALPLGYEALLASHYPEPVDHCDICPWIPGCREQRRSDDHLSLVAGISRSQRRELESREIRTMAALAALATPLPFKPKRGAVESFERARDQARLQVVSERDQKIVYELIPWTPPRETPPIKIDGLARLPDPSPGDVFLDLEGDALAGDQGREYLFGVVTVEGDDEVYQAWWADTAEKERRAFEAVVDFISERRERFPAMHVYHYAPYEQTAFKKLMGRYATREREIDELLRGRRFVDLYAVVRQGIRAGVERYSIKNLEPLYDFQRLIGLPDASRALRIMEQALELDRPALATDDVRNTVEGYNRDDCVSTRRLRDWLEARRTDLIAAGASFDRPPLVPDEASPELDEKAKAVEALRDRLLPDDYLLAYLLDWHRREDKAEWWEYFRLRELPEDDLFDETRALAGLRFVANVEQVKKSVIQRFSFPEQEFEIRLNDTLKMQDGKVFSDDIRAIDRDARTIDVLVGPSKAALHPTALFAHKYFPKKDIESALFDFGSQAADAGGVAGLPPSAGRALLRRESPVLRNEVPFRPPPRDAGAAVGDYAASIATQLDRTVLAIQGPPGSGKTFTGARMICALVKQGKKVGVVGPSHKVVRNLLDAVSRSDSVKLPGPEVRIGHKDEGGSNERSRADLSEGSVNVLGGTAFLWSRPEFADSVDVLFVDEAGQMSMANVLGIARAANSIVLLGDPQQLDQPTKGSHPDGVDLSALQHILGDAPIMPEGQGLFLPLTWRLAPPICRFTSEMFYEDALRPRAGLERQVLRGTGNADVPAFDGSGLWVHVVHHEGNRAASDEEAAAVVRIVESLLVPGSHWVDADNTSRPLTINDICIVAPFNAHVSRVREHFARRTSYPPSPEASARQAFELARIGTVDKFQGQEAPVVIYSMATSRPEDAPRGMEFLYSLNRLNVATSRAQCAVIVVASPALFAPHCTTPRQMQLANALCRFREMAGTLPAAPGDPSPSGP